MRTAELTGALLDYWVARAEGYKWADDITPDQARGVPPYSTDWAQGGPIIERERPSVDACCGDEGWYVRSRHAPCDGDQFFGNTLLEAAMRAYVASKFGDVVEDVQRAAQLDGGQGERK